MASDVEASTSGHFWTRLALVYSLVYSLVNSHVLSALA